MCGGCLVAQRKHRWVGVGESLRDGVGPLRQTAQGSLEAATPLSLGSQVAGSTTLDINHQDPQRPLGCLTSRRSAGRVEGTQPSAG